MRKYHDRMIALLALAAIAAVVAGSLMTIDALRAETRLEVARAQARYEAAQAQVDKLAARELLPEGMGEPVPLGDYLVTAYCCEEYPHICGGNGVTATGTKPTPGITAAADWGQLPPGSVIYRDRQRAGRGGRHPRRGPELARVRASRGLAAATRR